jgi:hypothetical protein
MTISTDKAPPATPTSAQPVDLSRLYRAKRDVVEFVDVPEISYLTVDGTGDPDGPAFADAIHALYAVSYGAHFAVRKATGVTTKVMPLEALWWSEGADTPAVSADPAAWLAAANAARGSWHWQAMIAQPPPIDNATVSAAIEDAKQKELPALDRIRFQQWTEGSSAQLMHVGPYTDEGPSVARLHAAIHAAGYVPRGRHHEIYLGDPRRCAPAKLRTILRQPVAAGATA